MGRRKLITSVRSILSDGLDYIYCIANGSSRKRTRWLHCGVQILASPIIGRAYATRRGDITLWIRLITYSADEKSAP